jgi:hypothetical protein
VPAVLQRSFTSMGQSVFSYDESANGTQFVFTSYIDSSMPFPAAIVV